MTTPSPKTILAVDTDPTVLMFISTLLRQRGHHVLEAKSGPKAVEILNMFPTKINFLVADVNMAPMSGLEVAENVRRRHPSVKTLYLVNNASARDLVLEDVKQKKAGQLSKPFTPANFLKAVDTVLK